MQTLILQTQNYNDLLIIIQLAQRLGISYTQKEIELPLISYPKVEKTELPENIRALVKPLRKTLDIETLKKEQNYKGANRQKIQQLIEEMAIEEPIEVLLAQLTP